MNPEFTPTEELTENFFFAVGTGFDSLTLGDAVMLRITRADETVEVFYFKPDLAAVLGRMLTEAAQAFGPDAETDSNDA